MFILQPIKKQQQCLVSMSVCRLIDGINITTSDEHMWLIPFSYGETHTLSVTFNEAQSIAGLRIWNYNKSPEDSYRGVKHFTSKLHRLLFQFFQLSCYFFFWSVLIERNRFECSMDLWSIQFSGFLYVLLYTKSVRALRSV